MRPETTYKYVLRGSACLTFTPFLKRRERRAGRRKADLDTKILVSLATEDDKDNRDLPPDYGYEDSIDTNREYDAYVADSEHETKQALYDEDDYNFRNCIGIYEGWADEPLWDWN